LAGAIRGLAEFMELLLKLVKQERLDVAIAYARHAKAYRPARLASNIAVFRFLPMIKRFASCAVLFLATTFLISACASRDEAVTDESTSQSAATVPGEKMSDDGSYAPGPLGTSGNVRW
jgi:hypothetical protein